MAVRPEAPGVMGIMDRDVGADTQLGVDAHEEPFQFGDAAGHHGVAAQPFTQAAQNIRRQGIDRDTVGTGERLVDHRQFDILETARTEMTVQTLPHHLAEPRGVGGVVKGENGDGARTGCRVRGIHLLVDNLPSRYAPPGQQEKTQNDQCREPHVWPSERTYAWGCAGHGNDSAGQGVDNRMTGHGCVRRTVPAEGRRRGSILNAVVQKSNKPAGLRIDYQKAIPYSRSQSRFSFSGTFSARSCRVCYDYFPPICRRG